MFLSDAKTRSIKPSDKPFKLTDSQDLYLVWSGLQPPSANRCYP
ncbi:integrase [Salmonella enterica]|nr:integrase [Salmonella enterica]